MNNSRCLRPVLFFALAVCLAGCRERTPPTAGGPARFEGRLLEIARTYQSYGLPVEEMRLTNVICAFHPTTSVAGVIPPDRVAKVSAGPDSSPHGKKLFYLFVKEPCPLHDDGSGVVRQPVGQAVVKEGWTPEELRDDGRPVESASVRRKVKVRRAGQWAEQELEFWPYVRAGGRLYHARQKAGLFVMYKEGPGTPGTDEGWVYGTVTADGRTVTSAGRVATCMGCHKDAPHDRLFGLPAE